MPHRFSALLAAIAIALCAASFVASAQQINLAERQQEVRARETAFAKTMADRDLTAFTSFISPDAVFVGAGGTTRGPKEIAAAWKKFFDGAQAPFSWRPETVEVLSSGTLALSSGPVFDPTGQRIATFNSTWRREADGVWRIIFDNGAQSGPVPDVDPLIEKLVASVSVDRLAAMLTTLASFGTRNTLSDTTSSTRGIGAARQWIFDELRRSSPKLQVSFDAYRVAPQGRVTREVEIRNVMAVLPGRSSRRIYVTGHYDSLNIPDQTRGVVRPSPLPPGFDVMTQPGQDFNVDAPGANDDGSGTVLTMELARTFAESGIEFDATLVFICWAGEEQGLIGSTAHAQRLAAEKVAVEAMFDNDIVGNSRGGDDIVDGASVRVYSEGPEDSMSRSLARYIQRLSALYVPSHRIRLFARQDRFGRGSDHQAFNGLGFPAVVFREANENYGKQHSANDTLDGVDFGYLAQNARVNTAAVASLALAPPAPGVLSERMQPLLGRGPSGYDANLRWMASPGAVAYRIYWRDAWATDWQHQQLVGNVTQFVLPKLSIDNVVVGVAAVGANGHESLVSAYVTAPRRPQDVKLVE